ncbi:MAG: hypothetical protein RTU09_06755 [Candidatus Thorarchaeota archaeon]
MKLKIWQLSYIIGMVLVLSFMALEALGIHGIEGIVPWVELFGGVLLIAGSCEAFVLSVEGIAQRYHLTDYVAGIYASIASTIPELSVITFLILAEQYELAWVLALATIFMNSIVFAIYTLMLPKDKYGDYKLPDAIMWVGSDLLSMGSVISLSVGLSMLIVFVFSLENPALPRFLNWGELIMFGTVLFAVFIAYLYRITKYYGRIDPTSEDHIMAGKVHHDPMPRKTLAIFLVLASLGALIGGEALANFAHFAEHTLNLNFLYAALLLVAFAGTPEYIIVGSSHLKDEIEIALSNAFGGIVQVFFVVFAYTCLAAGIIGGLILGHVDVIPIDLFSVVLLFFAFPTMFILHRFIADDSKVNALESIAMIAVFIMMLYVLLTFGIYPLN